MEEGNCVCSLSEMLARILMRIANSNKLLHYSNARILGSEIERNRVLLDFLQREFPN